MTSTETASEPARPPRQEVVEETHESLDVLRLERTPRDRKLELEQARLRDADEVSFSERSVAQRDALDVVRARVDALELHGAPRALPEARPPPPPPETEPEAAPEAPQADISPKERKALESRVSGTILRVDTVYKTGAGHAVEVTHKDGERVRTTPFILRNGEVADLDELGRVLDQMPLPEPRAAPAEPEPAAEPEETPAPEAPAKEEKPKRKGLFGKKTKEAQEQPGKEAQPESPPGDTSGEKKRRFGFRRNK